MPLDASGDILVEDDVFLSNFVPVPAEVLKAHKRDKLREAKVIRPHAQWRECAATKFTNMYYIDTPPPALMKIIDEVRQDDPSVKFRIGYLDLDPYVMAIYGTGPTRRKYCLGIYENGIVLNIAKRR